MRTSPTRTETERPTKPEKMESEKETKRVCFLFIMLITKKKNTKWKRMFFLYLRMKLWTIWLQPIGHCLENLGSQWVNQYTCTMM